MRFVAPLGQFRTSLTMDISRAEQRILHLLAQGGWIEHEHSNAAKVSDVTCFTRDGWVYPGLDLMLFRKLKALKAISSSSGKPYRITSRGLRLVRSQLDNR
jgi:uncharacterized protein YjhX (UPF0386 family)